jgi:hypothetical protein
MPDMTPVGNTGTQSSPLSSLTALIGAKSGMLGLQQQQQALQTGQYAQQTAQADSQQAQQKNGELQAAQKLVLAGVPTGKYTKADGSLDRQHLADDITTVAPTYGQTIASSLLSQANEIVSNKQALQGLNNSQKQALGSSFGALATKSDLSNSDIINEANRQLGNNPDDPNFRRMVLSNLTHLPQNGTPQQLQGIMRQWAIAATSPESATEMALPAQGTNAAGQNQNINKVNGARSMPQMGKGATNPTTAEVAGASARQTGTAGSDIDRANQVSGMQQQAAAAIPLTQRIDQLSDDIASGKVAKMISETGNYFGISSINAARSQLTKDLGQVKALAIQNSGSDARANTVLEGYPTDTTPTDTTHAAMDYIRGTARQNLARGQLLQQYQKSDPQGLRGFQAADSMLTGTTTPLMHEFMALPANQRAGFYKRNFSSPQEAQAFKDQVGAMQKHTTGIVSGGQ